VKKNTHTPNIRLIATSYKLRVRRTRKKRSYSRSKGSYKKKKSECRFRQRSRSHNFLHGRPTWNGSVRARETHNEVTPAQRNLPAIAAAPTVARQQESLRKKREGRRYEKKRTAKNGSRRHYSPKQCRTNRCGGRTGGHSKRRIRRTPHPRPSSTQEEVLKIDGDGGWWQVFCPAMAVQ